jgi:hypothetical protein
MVLCQFLNSTDACLWPYITYQQQQAVRCEGGLQWLTSLSRLRGKHSGFDLVFLFLSAYLSLRACLVVTSLGCECEFMASDTSLLHFL